MNETQLEQTAPFYEFGPFRVDTVKYVLTREGEVVPLNLKAFEILLTLIQHRGQVLEKNELLQRVWPDTVVEENNLARNISALRKALDEQPNEHQYILTVPGRGYRFVASVREVNGAREDFIALPANGSHANASAFHAMNGSVTAAEPLRYEATGESEALNGKTVPHKRWVIIALAALATLVTVVLAVALISRKSQDNSPAPQQRKLWQLTFDPGLESEPRWSPDERMIAYSSDQSGNFDIWVRPVGEGDPVRVTTSEAHDWQPDWAPEGNRLVFRSERDGGGLFVTPALGGKERKVSSFGSSPAWSPDGRQILFYSSSLKDNTVEIPKIYVVGLDGHSPREVMSDFLPQFDYLRVAWRPDGKHLSLWGWQQQHKWSFWTVPLDGGLPVKSEIDSKVNEQIRETAVTLSNFVWSPSGKTLYFEGISQTVKNLWKVEVEPQSLLLIAGPERLTTGAGPDRDIAISPDGRKLAFTTRVEQTRLWSLPFDASAGRIKGEGRPITAAGVRAIYPNLSPDGQRLAFVTRRAGKWELWEKSLKDGQETLLAADESERTEMHWSPDGSRMVYHRIRPVNPEGSRRDNTLVLMPSGGGAEQTITTPSLEG